MISRRAISRAIGQLSQAKPRPAMISFGGGCDFETPPLSTPSGHLRSAENYECDIMGGYARVMGYERYDGRTSPSSASAYVIDITLTGAIAVGDTVTGVTSLATGVVIVVPDSTHIVVTKVSGTFISGEVLNVAAAPQATTTSAPHGATTDLLRAQYKNLAADEYRDDIAVPTGSGNILGVVRFGDATYAWRDNAGGTATNIWKSTTAGWSQVTLYNEISFTAGGATQPAEAATLTQGGVTATIKRVVPTTASTTWALNTAAGRFIITNPAGGNFAAGAATIGAINVTLTAIQTAITLSPDGRYEFVVSNFGGSVATNRIYGCDGVNRGFEFDGTVLVPITTGMTLDAPNHVHVHKLQLFFSFLASVQHSGPGTPYIWSAILGASEIGMGDTVTGFQSQPGGESVGALAIFSRNSTKILYGTGVSNWQLATYRDELGAYVWSIQDIGHTMFLDDQGLTNLRTAQEFGNFAHAAVSNRIKSWLNGKRTKVTASCVVRNKSQYRLFFSDGYALYNTFSKLGGLMPVQLENAATCAWSSEDSDGSEVIFFGSTNGMVYQMEKGTSFDGEPIVHHMRLAWDWLKSPQLVKRFHSASLEVSGSGYAEFSFSYELGYGSTAIAQPGTISATTAFASSIWDEFQWDNFYWDGQTLMPSIVDLGGEAENISLLIHGSSDYHEAATFSGAMLHWAPRRYLR